MEGNAQLQDTPETSSNFDQVEAKPEKNVKESEGNKSFVHHIENNEVHEEHTNEHWGFHRIAEKLGLTSSRRHSSRNLYHTESVEFADPEGLSRKIIVEHHHHHEHTHHYIDPRTTLDAEEQNTLPVVPKAVLKAALLMSINALMMAFADVIIEICVLLEFMPKIPFRIDFLALTFLSALIGYHTLKGLKKRELDVTHDSTQVSLFVETALILGDVYLLATQDKVMPTLAIRLPFVILTFINICLIVFIIVRMHLVDSFKGWLLGYE